MQVILTHDVEKIGQRGDIVDVSRGYVRNFLVPRNLAEVATPGKMEEARREMAESEERDRRLAERAEEIAATLNKSVITIEARTGEDERLFGSVTAANVVAAVEKARGVRIDRRRVRLEEPIKSLGTHQVPIQVHGDVEASVKVIVVPKL
ncbi:MAG: 50S ribosomal protein L9 [Rubrobacter sp.]|nr:50S ribosomal protein L9 [Rubrobacter sp.]